MKKALLAALLAALMLVCTGCASFLERDYSVVQPHSSTYYEARTGPSSGQRAIRTW